MSLRTSRWKNKRLILQQRIRAFGLPREDGQQAQNNLFDISPQVECMDMSLEVQFQNNDSLQNQILNDDFVPVEEGYPAEQDHHEYLNQSELLNPTEQHAAFNDSIRSTDEHLENNEDEARGDSNVNIEDNNQNSKNEFVMKLARLSSRHHLSDICIADLIALFHESQSVPCSLFPRNLNHFQKLIGISQFNITYHWKCNICKCKTVKSAFDVPYAVSCCDEKIDENSDHFLLMDVKEQVSVCLKECNIDFLRIHGKDSELESQHGFVIGRDIRVTISTDGTPIFSSSKASLWPILGYIDNLRVVDQKQNMMILGLWISKGCKKPDFQLFLTSFVSQVKELHLDSVRWMDSKGQTMESSVYISAVICDSMARPPVKMINQFNAEYGCGYCYHKEPGHYYTNADIVLRSHQEHINICENIEVTGQPEYGVLSKSPFIEIPYFDIIRDFPIDVLHTVYLGVTEMFTNCWLTSKSRSKAFYINYESRKRIDAHYISIKPPKRVSHLPRSLLSRSSYKGHEWCMWLLYFSSISLKGVLPEAYYNHWLYLVNGVALLNCSQSKITNEMIERGGQLLSDFVSNVEALYDRQQCRFNVHLLLHLTLFVRRFGPLYLYSMLPFESYNLKLKSYITGPKGVGLQIVKRYCRDLTLKNEKNNSPCGTQAGLFIVNTFEETTEVIFRSFPNMEGLIFWKTINVTGKMLRSKASSKSKRRTNYLFWTDHNSVVDIYFFIQAGEMMHAVCRKFTVAPSLIQVNHIFEIVSEDIVVIIANRIIQDCLKIETDTLYLIKFVNNVECNAD